MAPRDDILLDKKNQNMAQIQGGHCPWSKFQGGQPTTPTPPCRAPALQSTGVEDQTFLCLVQDNFLTQHVLEPTRAARIFDIVLSSQKEFVDNVVIQEPLGSSDHNQLHFNIK